MKKKYHYTIMFLVFTVVTFLYSFCIFRFTGDEMWNYGFAVNIFNGLVPYRDFNMIITPFFAFSLMPIFYLLGNRLISFHIYVAIIVGLMMILSYKKIGNKAFLLYPIIILGFIPSYNLFCIFLFFILMLLHDSKFKQKDIYVGLVVGLMFLTKQTVGFALLIPAFFYAKKKVKMVTSFLIPCGLFLLYLIWNGALMQFIDYCFLGMLSFTQENGSFSVYTLITIALCFFLIYKLVKSKFKNYFYFYGLMFQIMAFPLGDFFHFFTAFAVIAYVLLVNYKLPKIIFVYSALFGYLTMSLFMAITIVNNKNNLYVETEQRLLYGRVLGSHLKTYVDDYEKALKLAESLEYDNLFVIASNSYFLKLSQEQTINKFDLINNGNMGYRGSSGYIDDLNSICDNSKCVFILEKYNTYDGLDQLNVDILKYPIENYRLKYITTIFGIYVN